MSDRHLRHPLKNFFIKKSIQIKIISQIIITVIIAACLTTGVLIVQYTLKSRTGTFYFMSDDVMKDLETQNMLSLILPSVIIVETIAILIAFGIGLISSRKIAVPVYKIERWASRLRAGKLSTVLAFREEDHLNELTTQCNGLTDFYKDIFTQIKTHSENIAQRSNDPSFVAAETKAIQQLLSKLELK